MKTRRAVFALLPAFLLCLGLMACAPEQAAPAPEAAQAVFAPAEPTAEPTAETPARETEAPGETAPPPETEAPAETAPPEAPDDRDPLQAAVEACATAEKTDQIVLAVDHALTFWERGEDGAWQKRMEAACGYGKNGLVLGEERIMGSKTTPIGAFPLTLAFSTGE